MKKGMNKYVGKRNIYRYNYRRSFRYLMKKKMLSIHIPKQQTKTKTDEQIEIEKKKKKKKN